MKTVKIEPRHIANLKQRPKNVGEKNLVLLTDDGIDSLFNENKKQSRPILYLGILEQIKFTDQDDATPPYTTLYKFLKFTPVGAGISYSVLTSKKYTMQNSWPYLPQDSLIRTLYNLLPEKMRLLGVKADKDCLLVPIGRTISKNASLDEFFGSPEGA